MCSRRSRSKSRTLVSKRTFTGASAPGAADSLSRSIHSRGDSPEAPGDRREIRTGLWPTLQEREVVRDHPGDGLPLLSGTRFAFSISSSSIHGVSFVAMACPDVPIGS